MLQRGPVPDDAAVKMAQTFRSGTNDIDAIDYVEMFLDDEQQIEPGRSERVYVLVNFRPVVTKKNWRMDCGVAGYDNTFGLPPFFPTRLRFEDYIYRLWIQQDGIVAAHVDAAQNHTKSNYMRNPPAAEIFNEEVANLLKRKIRTTVTRLDELSIAFDYEGEVTAQDAERNPGQDRGAHARALKAAETARSPERADALRLFAANLQKAFYGFEPDFFQQNLLRIVDDVVQRHQGLDRAVADAGGDLLLPEGPHRACRRSASRTRRRREATHANRTSSSALRKRAAEALRRHGTRRLLPDRGAGAAGARSHAVCQRRFPTPPQARARLPAGAVARRGLPRDTAQHVRLMELVFRDASRFDIIHFHCDYVHFPLLRRQCVPERDDAARQICTFPSGTVCLRNMGVPLVSISDSQRRPMPGGQLAGDGLSRPAARLHTYRERGGEYLAFLGRISPEKRLDRAIEIARRAGMPLKIAAKIYAEERAYFHETIEPLLRECGVWSSSSARSAVGTRTNSWATPGACSSRSTGPSPSAW